MDDEQWTNWKQKRHNTMICYLINNFFAGVDYSIVFATLYPYLEDMVKTDNPDFYYGFAIALFCFTSTLLGIIASMYLDKSRNIKSYTYVIIIMQILGYILYALPFSVAFPLMGRFIAGVGVTFDSVYTGEIVRIYDDVDSIRALWWLSSAYSIGVILGPIFSFAFKNVHFSIGLLEIQYLNIIGILMPFIYVVLFVITCFLMSDCSKELDLKECLNEVNLSMENISCEVNQNYQTELNHQESEEECTDETSLVNQISTSVVSSTSAREVLKCLCTSYDFKLIFLFSIVFSYILFGCELLTPLISYEIMHWDKTSVAIIYSAHGLFYVLLLIGLSMFCTSEKAIYKFCILCTVFLLVDLCIFIVMKGSERNYTRDVILMTSFLIGHAFSWCVQDVLIKCILARMVPSNIQGFVESLRFAVCQISSMISSLTVVLALRYLRWWSGFLIVILIIILLCLLSRKKTLSNIEVISLSRFRESKGKEF